MSTIQKAAFGLVALLVVGLALTTVDRQLLVMAIILMAVLALLTLPITWRVIMTLVRWIGVVIGETGHFIGFIGDGLKDWATSVRTRLTKSPSDRVPDWDELHATSAESPSDSPELVGVGRSGSGATSMSFIDEQMERQNPR